ncbi:hypothetical protein MARINON1_51480 [Marinobacter salarius]|nr:hypothetical protein MARINON1_51480 [Marinobacter salarius]
MGPLLVSPLTRSHYFKVRPSTIERVAIKGLHPLASFRLQNGALKGDLSVLAIIIGVTSAGITPPLTVTRAMPLRAILLADSRPILNINNCDLSGCQGHIDNSLIQILAPPMLAGLLLIRFHRGISFPLHCIA